METSRSVRVCKACGEEKPSDAFYRHPKAADGLMANCKECHKAAVRENRHANAEYYRAYDRARAFRGDRICARAEYQKKKKSDRSFACRQKERAKFWRDKNMVKRRAQVMACNAKRDGRLTPPSSCERCGVDGVPLHAHHENYYRPLDVTWLCHACHGVRHREINEMIRDGRDMSRRGFEPPRKDAA